MAYRIGLSWNNQQEGFQLPVNPGSIEISDGSKGQSYDVVELGEINVIKNPKLTTYRFSSIFPGQAYPFVVEPILGSEIVYDLHALTNVKTNRYVHYLTKWMASRRPIRFTFTGGTFDLNVAASIESFDWQEIAGSSGDIEYSLSLRKYIFYAARRITADPNSNQLITASAPRPDDRQAPKTYTMRAGDTLWKVAKTQLGDGARWREIQKLNGITDAQVRTLPVGKVLNLPG